MAVGRASIPWEVRGERRADEAEIGGSSGKRPEEVRAGAADGQGSAVGRASGRRRRGQERWFVKQAAGDRRSILKRPQGGEGGGGQQTGRDRRFGGQAAEGGEGGSGWRTGRDWRFGGARWTSSAFSAELSLPQSVKHWSLTTLREKLVKIGAKVVRHARYVIFQMAEVAVPKYLFRVILERIERLRLPETVPG